MRRGRGRSEKGIANIASVWAYKPFIRGLTAAIAMMITGRNRWTTKETTKLKFWDRRPFTRVHKGFKSYLTVKDYLQINQQTKPKNLPLTKGYLLKHWTKYL